MQVLAGVAVTASHNPKECNGYKVYDESGWEAVSWQAEEVFLYVDIVSGYSSINLSCNSDLIENLMLLVFMWGVSKIKPFKLQC